MTEPTTAERANGGRTIGGRLHGWLFDPVPLGRVAAFRTFVYCFVLIDVVAWSDLIKGKVDVDVEFYQPLQIARWLPLIPEPTPTVVVASFWALIIAAPIAATGRFPKLLGTTVFLLSTLR